MGMLIKKANMISLIVTPVSLGISFMSGVFVPLSMLGSTVKKIHDLFRSIGMKILNDMLSGFKQLSKNQLNTVYTNLLLQLLFAVAPIGGALFIVKYKREFQV